MDRPCDEFFSRPGFAQDQNRSVRLCHILKLFQHTLQLGTLPDDFFKLVGDLQLLFEVDVLPFRSLERFLRLLLLRKVANDGQHYRTFRPFDRAKHDIDWEFGTILALAVEFESGTHKTRSAMRTVLRSVVWMGTAESLRNQSLHRLAKQLRAAVSKNFLHLRVELSDFSFCICHHNSIGRIFKQGPESQFTFAQSFLGLFASSNVGID